MDFNETLFHGFLLKGELRDAILYLGRFPEQEELYRRYVSVFENEAYPACETDDDLNDILRVYQKYYREFFYLGIDPEQAAETMRSRFADLFGLQTAAGLGELEDNQIAGAFRSRSYQFLGGKTGGYFGPYIWKTTETETYAVELLDGIQEYTVRFLDGFLSKSWLDFISFGRMGTGGWTDGDGIINCVKGSYDVESENFQVSLLKHEAQHAMDLAVYQNLSSEVLEYRAKLVELIYSRERNLLPCFLDEADRSDPNNGHALASARLIEDVSRTLGRKPGELAALSIEEVQSAARELFAASAALCRKNAAGP